MALNRVWSRCYCCRDNKVKYVIPCIKERLWKYKAKRIIDGLCGGVCKYCNTEYHVTDTRIHASDSKLISCRCGPLTVAIYNNYHRCQNLHMNPPAYRDDGNIHIGDDCEMYNVCSTIIEQYPSSIQDCILPLLCRRNIAYSTYAVLRCDYCANNCFKYWSASETRNRTAIREVRQGCRCPIGDIKYVTDDGELYCARCYPLANQNVYERFTGFNRCV